MQYPLELAGVSKLASLTRHFGQGSGLNFQSQCRFSAFSFGLHGIPNLGTLRCLQRVGFTCGSVTLSAGLLGQNGQASVRPSQAVWRVNFVYHAPWECTVMARVIYVKLENGWMMVCGQLLISITSRWFCGQSGYRRLWLLGNGCYANPDPRAGAEYSHCNFFTCPGGQHSYGADGFYTSMLGSKICQTFAMIHLCKS